MPESLAIPTCTHPHCGEQWLDAETTEALERSLADAASMALASLSVEAIAVLAEHSAQRDLEDLLDLSRGYLSKVKHGKEKPSALLTALLALLTKDPEQGLGEVRSLWRPGAPSTPKPACRPPSHLEADVDPNAQITIREAYAAMYRYLERIYDLTGADELGGLLGSMSLLPDGQTADPGAWSDWIRAVEEVKSGQQNLDLSLKPNNHS